MHVAGVKEEEGGEKWRAGDSVKSSRFFARALDIYDAGVKRHPSSFDLAYNKLAYYQCCAKPLLTW